MSRRKQPFPHQEVPRDDWPDFDEASIGSDGDWPGFEMWAEDVRTFLPLIQQFGLASEEEIDIDTLADRLREETVSHGGTARSPIVVSAWTRTNV